MSLWAARPRRDGAHLGLSRGTLTDHSPYGAPAEGEAPGKDTLVRPEKPRPEAHVMAESLSQPEQVATQAPVVVDGLQQTDHHQICVDDGRVAA